MSAAENATLIGICSSTATIGAIAAEASRAFALPNPAAELLRWQIMCVAMMLPLTIAPLRHAAFRSFARRRNRAMALCATAYLAVWTALGAMVVVFQAIVDAAGERQAALVGALAIAAIWQFSPLKAKALRRCNRNLPLSPHGVRADADCIRFGLLIGANCTGSCGPIMAALMFAPHEPFLMLAAQTVVVLERYEVLPGHPRFLALAIRREFSRWLIGRRPEIASSSR
jgi:predicted metal-binding membrane protein